jgi:hypothetical protein
MRMSSRADGTSLGLGISKRQKSRNNWRDLITTRSQTHQSALWHEIHIRLYK